MAAKNSFRPFNILQRNRFRNVIDWLALVLLIAGGLNWGFIAIMDLNLVNAGLSSMPLIEDILYAFIGFAALYAAVVAGFSDWGNMLS